MPRNKKPAPAKPHESLKELIELTQALNLTALRDQLPHILERAENNGPSYTDLALEMLRFEANTRASRRLTRNLKRSGLAQVNDDLRGFDFSLRPKLSAGVVRELLNCRWVEDEGRNIICVGRPGLGKTRILEALGKAACLRGHTVLKVNTADMLDDLEASLLDHTYRRTFRRYEKQEVIICDEFGYDPFDADATKHLFRLVSARHRKRSILLAANTGFKSWKNFFPSEAQAVATVDRLIDNATILRFSGKSFRQPKDVYGSEDDG